MKVCRICSKEIFKQYTKMWLCLACGRAYTRNINLSPASRWANIRKAALRRGIEFSLTKEEFTEIISKPCIYGAHSSIKPTHVGVDRKNNEQGYTMENGQPCCSRHNCMKNEYFTHEEMLFIIAAVKSAKNCGMWDRK